MAEYIERKKLEEAFDNADPDVCECHMDGYSDWGFGRENVRDVIRGVPAADVTPVVRCKDCKHRSESGNCGHPRHHGILPSAYPYDFCSYGERRDYD